MQTKPVSSIALPLLLLWRVQTTIKWATSGLSSSFKKKISKSKYTKKKAIIIGCLFVGSAGSFLFFVPQVYQEAFFHT
ncbi:hypothetical protein GDO78_022617 [Eleutherodactylus coqui]|uniref:Uncharacterized protein n=1 Tax=Eleutherodactylus coqui TaxID=57060 RepID=A0A8J6BCC4_ELECQ|nr:hypothetical protein GDO78_022617 [Eleutherodactylus coqui]